MPPSRHAWTTGACILALPFLLLWWLNPLVSGISIGQDYRFWSINEQLELFFSVARGSYPLYMHGYAGGASSATTMLGQLTHPLSWLATSLPLYWSGHALDVMTFLRLGTLGLAHLLLHGACLSLGLARWAAFVLSVVTVYNLRMLDLFRYGASLEAWTGLVFACALAVLLWTRPASRLVQVGLAAAVGWCFTSGYPPALYYFSLVWWLHVGCLPFLAAWIRGEAGPDRGAWGRHMARALACWVAGLALAAAFLAPFYVEFLGEKPWRANATYAFADSNRDTALGTVLNWLHPLGADVHGAFGGAALQLLLPLWALLCLWWRRGSTDRPPRVVWAYLSALLLLLLFMQGGRLPLHRWFWEYAPMGASIRVAGRAAIVAPALLLGLGAVLLSPRGLALGRSRLPVAALLVALLSALGWALTSLGPPEWQSILSASRLRNAPAWVHAGSLLLSLSVAGVCWRLGQANRGGREDSRWLHAGLAGGCLLQIGLTLAYGAWITPREAYPTLERIAAMKRDSLDYILGASDPGMASRVFMRQNNASFTEPWLGALYSDILFVPDRETALRQVDRERLPEQAVVEGPSPSPETRRLRYPEGPVSVSLAHASYNRLLFRTESSTPAVFVLGRPYNTRWQAWVDGNPAGTMAVNGGSVGVLTPPGTHAIEWRVVSPAATAGWAVSCLALALLGCHLGLGARRALVKAGWCVLCVGMGAGLFLVWRHSLYSGENLETRFQWDQTNIPRGNLAFGKTARSSSQHLEEFAYLFQPRHAVDGSALRSFASVVETDPWWEMDMGAVVPLGRLSLRLGAMPGATSVEVAVSADNRVWTHTRLDVPANAPCAREWLPPEGTRARFVRVTAASETQLVISELDWRETP